MFSLLLKDLISDFYWKKAFWKTKIFAFFQTLEASNKLPVNVGQLIFIPCIVCIWPYPMVSKHIAFLSEWGSFKKCLASITHEYAMAVERIWKVVYILVCFATKFIRQDQRMQTNGEVCPSHSRFSLTLYQVLSSINLWGFFFQLESQFTNLLKLCCMLFCAVVASFSQQMLISHFS